ncbi:hypothetical protein [Proteus terrae]|uniref:hypothetical protein n=1 Tax=Proteus terrae TaxID=1574161 RepID=UPI00301CE235
MKRLLLSLVVLFFSFNIYANDEIDFIKEAKDLACKGNVNCEKYFMDGVGASAIVSRYHGSCIEKNERTETCTDAEGFYDYVISEQENSRK